MHGSTGVLEYRQVQQALRMEVSTKIEAQMALLAFGCSCQFYTEQEQRNVA